MKSTKSKNVKISFRLKSKEKHRIRELLSKGKESVRVINRAYVVKLFDKGYTSPKIAEIVGINAVTVRDIGWRYVNEGLERALYDLPRPGCGKQVFNVKQSSLIIALVCSEPPEGYNRWSIQLLTKEVIKRGIVSTVGRETIRILLKNHDLKPWREKNVVHSGDNG